MRAAAGLPPGRAPSPRLLRLAGLLLLLACGPEDRADAPAPGPPRLVILYASCTVNPDYLAPYDPGVAYTPNLAAFARESVVFTRHNTEAGQSGIAFASIFTGAQATGHGVYRQPVTLADDRTLIAEAYAQAGYDTFFWNDHEMASASLGYAQGVAPEHVLPSPLQGRDAEFAKILGRLAADPGYKAFVLTNFSVTHGPYPAQNWRAFLRRHPGQANGVGPEAIARALALYRPNHIALAFNLPGTVRRMKLSPQRIAELTAALDVVYRSAVMHLDGMFGGVVRAVRAKGLLDQSLIAFTADHGEVLYRENAPFQWSHAMQLASEVVRVPLLIRSADPRVSPGRYDGVTRSIDVFPTLLSLSGVPLPQGAQVQGVDLAPALRGQQAPPVLTAPSHTSVLVHSVYERMQSPRARKNWEHLQKFFPDESPERIWVSLREGDLFYRFRSFADGRWRTELFDLARDPGEERDLFDASDAKHAEMARALADYKAELVGDYRRRLARGAEPLLPAPEAQERLREMGYIE